MNLSNAIVTRDDYSVSTDKARLDTRAIHAYLSNSYWCEGIPLETIERAIEGSLCFGLYHRDRQIGFARVITDQATFAYLCDVYVLSEFQGRGLGTWMMQTIVDYPALQGLRRFVLVTRDAHPLYKKFGFQALARPECYMEVHVPNIYMRS